MLLVDKYRPHKLDDVVGHKYIIKLIKNYVRVCKLPNILMYGKSGVGKTATVMAMARELYGSDFEKEVFELNVSDERGIDVIRNKIKALTRSKSNSRIGFKLIILDEADYLTKDAQAALRKIMEDYSDKSIFCLVCNSISKITPPIQSRCVSLYFKGIGDEDIHKNIERIVSGENMIVSNEQINRIVEISNGDMRRAILYLQSIHMKNTIQLSIETNVILTYQEDKLFECVKSWIDSAYDISVIYISIFNDVMNKWEISDIKKVKVIRAIMISECGHLNMGNEFLHIWNLCCTIRTII